MSGNELPKVIDKTQDDIDAAIAAIQSSDLSSSTKDFAISCIKLALWLPKALLEHKIRLSSLRKLIFGRGKKDRANPNSNDVKPSKPEENPADQPEPVANYIELSPSELPAKETSVSTACDKPPGHGRLAHTAYANTNEHTLAIHNLKHGDFCPERCGGKLYRYEPGIMVRIKGQNLAAVHKYWIEKLRCATCGHLIQASIPDHVGDEKYDAAFKSILVLQKYYVAVSFYRQAYFQSLLGMPLPVTTQWQLIEDVFSVAICVFKILEQQAANGDLIHNDDTHVKINDLIRFNRSHPENERTGMFTTGILSRVQGRDIALFYNGTKHAGENLTELLSKRKPDSNPVIQMCDALSRNISATFKTILCNCLSHGLRKLDDLKEFYPEPCLHIIKLIADVYEHDEKTKGMDQELRLTHHQEHSEPIMKSIHEYMMHQLESKQVEPNDSLGVAIRYMLKHWHELTQFLRVPGAPLDNNVLERTLKIPIRGRRTWLFYKTKYGAMVGGVLTSVIYTCELAGINPLTYLTALQEHKKQIVKEPNRWLPWNYQENFTPAFASAA